MQSIHEIYLIKTKSVWANYGSENQFKVKKNFLNEGAVKFLQIKQATIRQKHLIR